MLRALAGKLEEQGVALDWSAGQDCSANLGRYALDIPLEVAIGESRDESIALLLLDLGLKGGQGSAEQLNANPLLRLAAAQGMLKLVERLVRECGADVDARDPRFGGVALDRAVDAGHEAVALKLLELGANPRAGRGVDSLLQRASPRVRSQLALRGTARGGAGQRRQGGFEESIEPFEDLRRRMRSLDEGSALVALEGRLEGPAVRPSPAELALLLEDAVRTGYRQRLLRRLCTELREAGMSLGWGEDTSVDRAAGFLGRRPLDAALQAAIEENADERAALFVLEEGLDDTVGSASRLNAGPLLRSAASKCRPAVVGLLARHADAKALDAVDPRFGGTALDRAVEARCWSAARALLDAGASLHAGRGLQHLLARASPEIKELLRRAA